MRRMNQRGDTIVEVLIAVGIVSMVLAAAYALTSRNTRITQEVQEQSYAQKLVEEQVETLRSMGASSATVLGCFNGAAVFSPVGAACERQNGGVTYNLSINPTNDPVYEITADWVTLGSSDASVTVYYRAN